MHALKLGCEQGMGDFASFDSSDLPDTRFVWELMNGHWHCGVVCWAFGSMAACNKWEWGVVSQFWVFNLVYRPPCLCTLVLQWCDFINLCESSPFDSDFTLKSTSVVQPIIMNLGIDDCKVKFVFQLSLLSKFSTSFPSVDYTVRLLSDLLTM